jgi:hypothetical protein
MAAIRTGVVAARHVLLRLSTSVRDRKIDGGFRFKAMLSEHGIRLELLKGVAGA